MFDDEFDIENIKDDLRWDQMTLILAIKRPLPAHILMFSSEIDCVCDAFNSEILTTSSQTGCFNPEAFIILETINLKERKRERERLLDEVALNFDGTVLRGHSCCGGPAKPHSYLRWFKSGLFIIQFPREPTTLHPYFSYHSTPRQFDWVVGTK